MTSASVRNIFFRQTFIEAEWQFLIKIKCKIITISLTLYFFHYKILHSFFYSITINQVLKLSIEYSGLCCMQYNTDVALWLFQKIFGFNCIKYFKKTKIFLKRKPVIFTKKSIYTSILHLGKLLINIFNNIRSMYPLQHGKNLNYCDDECISEEYLFQIDLY